MRVQPLALVGVMILVLPRPIAAQPALQVLHSFTHTALKPGEPVQAPDGSLYGTLLDEGARGGIYRVAPNGEFSVVHSFAGGGAPGRQLLLATDGNLYGVTAIGGLTNDGTAFRFAPATGALTTLHEFSALVTGSRPNELMEAADGFLYGTTSSGGSDGVGTIFRMNRSTGDVVTLVSFGQSGPSVPSSGLVQSGDGMLYGTSEYSGFGTIYRLDPSTGSVTVLHALSWAQGQGPSGLVRGRDGHLYGACRGGGAFAYGSLFRLDPATGAFVVVHSFDPSSGDGRYPHSRLTLASDGDFYGTTDGLRGSPPTHDGSIYRLHVSSLGVGTLTTLRFVEPGFGFLMLTGVIQAADGFLYGSAEDGPDGAGVLFRLDPLRRGQLPDPLQFAVVHTFGSSGEGWSPISSPVEAGDAFLYGTTRDGGLHNAGTVYRLDRGTGIVTTLHSFSDAESVALPRSVTPGGPGVVYGLGTTRLDALFWPARLFRLELATSTVTALFAFTGENGLGTRPSGLTRADNGSFYGTTLSNSGQGAIFRFDPATQAVVAVAQLAARAGGSLSDASRLLAAGSGWLYGTTSEVAVGEAGTHGILGRVFRFHPVLGVLETVHAPAAGGLQPRSGLVEAADGMMYVVLSSSTPGATEHALLRLNPTTGAAAVSFTFSGSAFQSNSSPRMAASPDGSIALIVPDVVTGRSTLYRVDPSASGLGTPLPLPAAAGNPEDLSAASDGRIYGVTSGGVAGGGAIFRVSPAGSPPPLDTDGDGLPNDWEIRFGLNPSSSIGAQGADADPDGDGRTTRQEYQEGTHPRGLVTRYLAEGATGTFFSTRVAVLNPGSVPASVLFRFLRDDGRTTDQVFDVPPASRATLEPALVDGLAHATFSTVIESDMPVAIDRTMTWDGGGYGSHAETAAHSPAMTWYLAEGSTSGDFNLFYLLQNPGDQEVSATVRYLLPFGLAPLEKQYTLRPHSRRTIYVDAEGGVLSSTDVSAVVSATAPVIVERAMYFSKPGQPFAAGHESAGVTAPALEWTLAEGATGSFFDLFVLVANPNATPAEITAEYLFHGGVARKAYTVPANGRFTIWVDDEELPAGSGVKPLAHAALSTIIRSTNGVPVIVERSMWWPGAEASSNFRYEAHSSAGVTQTGTRWALADCETGGPAGTETYILIANTSSTAGRAQVTLFDERGGLGSRTYALPPRSRTTVPVGVEFPSALGRRVGALIQSLGPSPAQIVVERAMYSSPGGVFWAAGSNATGTLMP